MDNYDIIVQFSSYIAECWTHLQPVGFHKNNDDTGCNIQVF